MFATTPRPIRFFTTIFPFTAINLANSPTWIEDGTSISFLMNSVGADLHSKIFDFFFVEEEFKKENWNYREGGHWIHPHYFLHKCFNIVVLRLPTLLVRPVRDLEVLKEFYNSLELVNKIVANLNKYKLNPKTFKNRIL